MQRWSQHSEAALKHPRGTVNFTVNAESTNGTPDLDIRTDEPTLGEVLIAVKTLKSRQLPVHTPEFLKCDNFFGDHSVVPYTYHLSEFGGVAKNRPYGKMAS